MNHQYSPRRKPLTNKQLQYNKQTPTFDFCCFSVDFWLGQKPQDIPVQDARAWEEVALERSVESLICTTATVASKWWSGDHIFEHLWKQQAE